MRSYHDLIRIPWSRLQVSRGVYVTFTSVFPYVLYFERRGILVGSGQPLIIRADEWIARLRLEEHSNYLGGRIIADIRSGVGSNQTDGPRESDDSSRISRFWPAPIDIGPATAARVLPR